MTDEQVKSKARTYAFPSILNIYGLKYEQTGMTLRDWFAGQAILQVKWYRDDENKDAADWAYRIADAMLEAREKYTGENDEPR